MVCLVRMSVVALALLAGCSAPLQVGLVNAPWLGGDTPETRVHDVIANGHEACQRSGFPQGDVLRGHTPPCAQSARLVPSHAFLPKPPSSHGNVTRWHSLGVCAPPGPGLSRTDVLVTGISLDIPSPPVCDDAI